MYFPEKTGGKMSNILRWSRTRKYSLEQIDLMLHNYVTERLTYCLVEISL
jgi:hypothetical protein